jgi:TPR repeat protein
MTIIDGKKSLFRLSQTMLGLGFAAALALASGASFAGDAADTRAAAEQGHATGQTSLGVMYDNGNGVPQDYVRAHTWFNLAASRGNPKGSKNRDIVAKRMTPAQIVEVRRLAREWKPKPE